MEKFPIIWSGRPSRRYKCMLSFDKLFGRKLTLQIGFNKIPKRAHLPKPVLCLKGPKYVAHLLIILKLQLSRGIGGSLQTSLGCFLCQLSAFWGSGRVVALIRARKLWLGAFHATVWNLWIHFQPQTGRSWATGIQLGDFCLFGLSNVNSSVFWYAVFSFWSSFLALKREFYCINILLFV